MFYIRTVAGFFFFLLENIYGRGKGVNQVESDDEESENQTVIEPC